MQDASVEIQVKPPATPPDSRWQILGGLRFALAMVVAVVHLTWFQKPNAEPLFLSELSGTSAVLGFLVVSGYSIGHSLRRRPVGFFQRRVLRIYPLYVVAVLYSLVPYLSGADALATRSPFITFERPHWWVVIGNLLMMQNLICPTVSSNGVVWTLGIEVICYSLAPWFERLHTLFLTLLIAISAAAYSVLFPHMVRMGYGHYSTLMWGLPLLMFAWAWIAGFVLQRYRNSIAVGIATMALGVGALTLNREFSAAYSRACLAGAVAVVILSPKLRVSRGAGVVLNYLGDLSYPIYLFHLPTFLLGYCVMNIDGIGALMALALTVSAAFLFIESILKPVITRSWSRDKIPTAG